MTTLSVYNSTNYLEFNATYIFQQEAIIMSMNVTQLENIFSQLIIILYFYRHELTVTYKKIYCYTQCIIYTLMFRKRYDNLSLILSLQLGNDTVNDRFNLCQFVV